MSEKIFYFRGKNFDSKVAVAKILVAMAKLG